MNRVKSEPPDVCPVCHEDVPPKSLACPSCGADFNSGWKEDASMIGDLGDPEDDFDYDEFLQNEFGSEKKPKGIKWLWWLTAILLSAILLFYFIIQR